MTFINKIQQNLNILSTQAGSLKPPIFKGERTQLYPSTLEPSKDSFITNPMYDGFETQAEIEAAAKSNPRIMGILSKYNIPLKINMAELEKLKAGHMKDVRVNAAKIYSSLPQELKSQVNPSILQQAAMLHDYGKLFIPEEILNKPGALTQEEREIVEQHSELGYELLKSKGVDEEVLELVKNHHRTANGGGYPKSGDDCGSNLGVQILRAADIYSALTEQRVYKKAMTRDKALETMYKDVETGKMSEEVYRALEKAV